jgi:phospholipase C
MKIFHRIGVTLALLLVASPALATVTVTSPAAGATVTSPVHYVATATTTTCSKGVGSMGIYVDNKLVYTVNGTSLNTELTLAAGAEHTVVEEWDHCGGASYTTINLTVTASSAAPTVTLSASPTSIVSGSSSSLKAVATNATQVTITGTDGSSYTLSSTGGTQAVSPAATTTYTATATGTGGKATATTTVTVTAKPVPTVTIGANPTSIASGASSTLTVTAANATQVVVTGTDGSSYALSATGGTQAVSPAATTTYTATATGTGGQVTATATVTVAAKALPTVTISASPTSVASGGASTLTVAATNATQVVVTGTDGSSYTLLATGGSQAVNPTVTTTYTATATGTGGKVTATATVTVAAQTAPTVTITANPTTVVSGNSSTLTVTATNATQVVVTGTDGSSYTLQQTGGTQSVNPTATTTYTAEATGGGGNVSATATVTVNPAGSVQSINHVIFELQENHTFDNYFGMLNPYRHAKGWNVGDDGNDYEVDGIDDKLTTLSNVDDAGTAYAPFKLASTCIDDDSSDWLASYGDVNRYNFLTTRPINMDGFVHDAEGYANSCAASGTCSGAFTDLTGERAMGYYDQGFLNYYYYMASQFALSNRWFSPMSDKSVSNRIATFSGGTTQGLVLDPAAQDHLPQLAIQTIFQELQTAGVSWKIYYTVTQGFCLEEDECSGSASSEFPATWFTKFTYSTKFLYENPSKTACTGTTQASSVVGDASNSFCIDTNHVAPLADYYTDLTNGTLPSFAFIESGSGVDDEHPGSGQSVLTGQAEMAKVINAFMASPEWNDSVFFFSYDEGGGPYDHVPPVAGHSNENTDASLGTIPDISQIAVNPDTYFPCLPTGGVVTTHCDLTASYPGAHSGDAPAVNGFAAQLGFRLPNFVVSPFTRRHYVSNIPMDHTAVIRFVEDRFIGNSKYLTARDAAQPNLLDFFDFNNVPWATPPSPPAPVTSESLGYNPCTPTELGP